MEDAENVSAVCSATPTSLDCTGDLLDEECLPSLEVAIILGEVWGLPVMVMPSFTAVNSFDRPP